MRAQSRMSSNLLSTFDQWRAADAEARLAELAVSQALEEHLRSGGPPVPDELQEAAIRLRRHAIELLETAMQALRESRGQSS